MALAFIVVADLFPPHERGKYGGLMSAVMAISTIIGPIIGGYLTDYFSWRWCFFMNVPLAIIIIFLFIIYFPQYRPGSKHKVDYAGAMTMVLAIAPLMLALTWGGVDYEWLSPTILGMIFFSVIMFIIFFIIEKRAEEPIVPIELFKLRVVTISSISVFLLGATFIPAVTFIPLYFQGVLGTSASQSGSFLMPMMLSSVVASILCGQILARTGGYYRLQSIIGFALIAAGFYLISTMTVDTSYSFAIFNIILTGLGAGLLMPIHTLAVQNTVSYSHMGAATSLMTWLRTIGGLFGLSIVGSIMNNRFSSEFIRNLTPDIKVIVPQEQLISMVSNPQALVNAEARIELQRVFEGMGAQGLELYEQVILTLQNALNTALTESFAVLFIGVILALLASIFLKGIPYHKHVKGELMTDTED
jgi:EmrB/QacA subfamily drug resistance transporter